MKCRQIVEAYGTSESSPVRLIWPRIHKSGETRIFTLLQKTNDPGIRNLTGSVSPAAPRSAQARGRNRYVRCKLTNQSSVAPVSFMSLAYLS